MCWNKPMKSCFRYPSSRNFAPDSPAAGAALKTNRCSSAFLNPDEPTSRHYANVYQQLRRQGTPIPTNDIWIAAMCLQHNLTLYARDAHFDHIPQLTRI